MRCNSFYFYIKPQHEIAPKLPYEGCNSFYFYIKPQLLTLVAKWNVGCNSFYFYIKPQHLGKDEKGEAVVIHSISTSNHNSYECA